VDFNIPAAITAYLAELDAFIAREIKPLERENDNIRFFDHRREWARTDFDRGGLPRHEWEALLGEMRRRADKAGHYRFALPKEYGGKDGSNLAMAVIREHLAAKGLGLHNDLQNESSIVGNLPTVLMFRDFGTKAQRDTFIPGILDGSISVAFGLTEPNHGSDATWMETRGVREGDGWQRREDLEHRPARRNARFRLRAHQRTRRRRQGHHVLHRPGQSRRLQD
jgi:acyl-CoA dehydrogenase